MSSLSNPVTRAAKLSISEIRQSVKRARPKSGKCQIFEDFSSFNEKAYVKSYRWMIGQLKKDRRGRSLQYTVRRSTKLFVDYDVRVWWYPFSQI